jgi:hypothetical protein
MDTFQYQIPNSRVVVFNKLGSDGGFIENPKLEQKLIEKFQNSPHWHLREEHLGSPLGV